MNQKNNATQTPPQEEKVEEKKGLDNYCFTMRNTLQEEKLKDKFEAGDKFEAPATADVTSADATNRAADGAAANQSAGEVAARAPGPGA